MNHSSDGHNRIVEPDEHASVGDLLRARREARGMTLDDVCQETRVVKDYLAAVEAGEFGKLASPAYARGIIRAYATCIGLSADDMVLRYEQQLSDNSSLRELEYPSAATRRTKTNRWEKGWWIAPLSLFVVIVVTALLFRENDHVALRKSVVKVPTSALNMPEQVHDRNTSARSRLPVNGTSFSQPATVSTQPVDRLAKGIFLKIKAAQDSGLTITIDGAVTQHYDLKSGDLIEWKGEQVFSLDIDNPGGVEAEFNGKPLVLSGGHGAPVHLELKPNVGPPLESSP